MDLPYCKICGERHRLGFCPEFGPMETGLATADKVAARTDVPQTVGATASARDLDGEPRRADAATYGSQRPHQIARDILYVAKPKFDKRTYQRELMRKRRAEGKA
jgi:hypothetical protein